MFDADGDKIDAFGRVIPKKDVVTTDGYVCVYNHTLD